MFITLYFIVTRLPDSLRVVRDHFLSLDPTSLIVDLLDQHLLAPETSGVAVGAAQGTLRPPFFEGCSPSPLAPAYAPAAAVDIPGAEDVGAASASAKRRSCKGKGSKVGGGGSGSGVGDSSGGVGGSGGGGSGGSGGGGGGVGGGGGGSSKSSGSGGGGTGGGGSGARRGGPGGGHRQQQQRRSETPSPQQLREWLVQRGTSGGSDSCPYVIRTGVRAGQICQKLHTQHRCFSHLDNAWRTEFGDDAELPRWADLLSAEGDYYRCVQPDPGIAAAALGASESGTLPGTVPAQALHTFTLDSGASRYFFRDSTTLTPLPAPVPVRLADPSGGPVVARSSTVLPCLAVPSSSLSGHHLPSFSTNLVSTAALQDAMVTTTTPGDQCVSICTCTRAGRHLATFTHWPGSSMYTLATEPPQGATFAQVSASGQVAASCSCRLLSHQTLLTHHLLGHPSLPCLHGMHSRLLVSGLPRSLPPLLPSPAAPCLPCVEGRQRAAPHSSSFPPTTAPLQTLHMDVHGGYSYLHDPSTVYHLFPFCSAPPPPPPLFLAPGPPPVDPLPPQGSAPSSVSQVDTLPETAPVEGAGSGGAEPRGDEPGGAEPEGVEPGGAKSEGAESGGAEPQGAALSGGPAGASLRLSPQQLREWLIRSARLWSRSTEAGGAGDTGAGGAGVTAGAGGLGGTAAAGSGGARTRGTEAAETGGVEGTGAARAGGPCSGGAGSEGAGPGGPGVGGTGAGGAGAAGDGGVDPEAGGTGGTSQPPLQPASPVPAPSPYTERSGGLTERREPSSCPVSPVCTTRCAPRSRPPPVPGMHAMALCPSFVPLRVPLSAPLESSLSEVPDPESDRARAASPTVSRLFATSVTNPLNYATALVAESAYASPPSVMGECALGTDVLEDRQEEFECLAVAVPRVASMLLAPEGDPDAPEIPTQRSYAEAITVDGMWIFRVKRPPGSPPAFKACYVARGFSQRHVVDYFQTFSPTPKMTTLWVLLHVALQRDYELHSLDFSTAFLQGSLHEEIWLRRPPGFNESFPAGTQWSLRRPVYGHRQAPREWHDTLRTSLAALGFAPATADLSLFP
ncbi:unnamed protein product [Closterium sp. NIES-54]